jgi:ATP synthase protein I
MNDRQDRDSFERRLLEAREKAGLESTPEVSSPLVDVGGAATVATRVIVELTIPIVLAGGLGWWLDRVFHVAPWLLIVSVPFGMAAGIKGVLRSAGAGGKT